MQRSTVTVLEAATNFDLLTLEDLKAYLNITSTAEDVRLRSLISFASRLISDYCDRVFALEKVSEVITTDEPVLDGVTLAVDVGINLDRWPVQELFSCQQDLVDVDYLLDPVSGTLRGALTGETTVVYRAGYSLPDQAPAPLSMAAMDWIRSSYYFGSRDPMVQSITDNASGSIRFFPPPGISTGRSGSGGGSSTPQSRIAFSPTATALLSQYKRPGMA